MDSYKNNNDPFKQFVKSKLADYKEDVPSSGWEQLESSLFAAQKTKVLHRRWLASSVAAVAAIFIGVFFMFQNINKELPLQTSQQQVAQQQIEQAKEQKNPFIAKQKATQVEKSTTTLLADNASKTLLSKQKYLGSQTIRDKGTSLVVSSDILSKTEDSALTPATDIEAKADNRNKSSEINEKTKQQLIEDFINEGNRTLDVADDTSKAKRRSKYSISLSGRSGLSSSQENNTLPSTLRSSVSESYSKFTIAKMQALNDEEVVNAESETSHMQPISFGVLTSFDLTRKLQIETGLIYTYLSSETKSKSSDFNNSEQVQFHYLGIPVNVNYTLLSLNKLNLFLTGGAMIEKDISGKIKYSDEKKGLLLNSGYANENSSKIKQQNPQFSVTAGVGVTYPIYNKASLFGKVGGRYYIKANNEYKTYYSDEKFGLDIQLGIKFNF